MVRVFISYRRDDSDYVAGFLYERLIKEFQPSSVFKDVIAIRPGTPFSDEIVQAIKDSDVLIALIGRRWEGLSGGTGYLWGQHDDGVTTFRIDDPEDLVRRELEVALLNNVYIVPVTIEGVQIGEVHLPPSIERIREFQSIAIRAYPDFAQDCDKLIGAIKHPNVYSRPLPEKTRQQLVQELAFVRSALKDVDDRLQTLINWTWVVVIAVNVTPMLVAVLVRGPFSLSISSSSGTPGLLVATFAFVAAAVEIALFVGVYRGVRRVVEGHLVKSLRTKYAGYEVVSVTAFKRQLLNRAGVLYRQLRT